VTAKQAKKAVNNLMKPTKVIFNADKFKNAEGILETSPFK
jgi:hypothetical protein